MHLGRTFKLLGEDSHLWMIISDPKLNPTEVVLVNFTTWQHIHDQTCVVNKGEHPFLATKSVVNYRCPLIRPLEKLKKREQEGLLSNFPDLSPELLKKIQMGALNSRFLPLKAQIIMSEQFPDLLDEAY